LKFQPAFPFYISCFIHFTRLPQFINFNRLADKIRFAAQSFAVDELRPILPRNFYLVQLVFAAEFPALQICCPAAQAVPFPFAGLP
jgi:hypothetical protein